MFKRTTIVAILAFSLIAAFAAKQAPRIVESWHSPTTTHGKFNKLLIVAITDNEETRRHFEDKFVSHLRGHGIEAVTSHSLVEDLQHIENVDEILTQIGEQKIDGALSIGLKPLSRDRDDEAEWRRLWVDGMEQEYNMRMLIEKSLPVRREGISRYGLDITIWETENRNRVWAGRTDGHKVKHLKESAGDFIGYTLAALKDAGLL